MPWQLTVFTIDVGQGESALVVAENAAAGQHRTMLIDGGRQGWAETVHNFIHPILNGLGYALDHILLSHYDDDHSGGVIGLLNADNMRVVCELVSNAAANGAQWAAAQGFTRPQQIACGAVAATGTILGAYGANAGQIEGLCAGVAPHAVGMTDQAAARTGYDFAVLNVVLPLSPTLEVGATLRRRQIAEASSIAAANAIALGGNVPAAAYGTAFPLVVATLTIDLRFDTEGRYLNVHLIDIGGGPQQYVDAAIGEYITQGGNRMIAPGVNRARTTPALDDEILWNSGAGPMPAPNNSPAMFCLAINSWVWQGIGAAPIQIGGGQPGNDVSIGLIIRFGNFYFYTGGDLPWQGEDPLAAAVMAHPLPNPQGGANFPPPARIAAFKCGHHGSAHSTSQAFLNTTLAVGAFISCGLNQFGPENHPSQATVDRLDGQALIAFFYLTNCNYITNHVPASTGQDQLVFPGNKSRVAGENHLPNLQAGRHRGNITLTLSEAESAGNGVPQQYHVDYYDDDVVMGAPGGIRAEVTAF